MGKRAKAETDVYGGFMRRCVRALGRRANEGDLSVLTELTRLREQVDAALVDAARSLNTGGDGRPGYSWTEIGAELGVTRQNAQQRFGVKAAKAPAPQLAGQSSVLDLVES